MSGFWWCAAAAAVLSASVIAAVMPPSRTGKLLVAHRGASAYAPEHTLEAYDLAIEQRADYVEQDLALTRDGVLVCIHDPSLERTTNAEQIFPDRGSTVDGVRRWMVADFTFEEIQRLDAGSWFDAKFADARVPSWQQAIDRVRGRAGLFPELKEPALYRGRGADLVPPFVASLRKNGLDRAGADPETPLIVQSFDVEALKGVASALPDLPRVFLIEVRDGPRWLTEGGLREIAQFAGGIGPSKALLDRRPDVVAMARRAGLTVTPYTFRARLPGGFATVRAEMAYFLYELDVDGVFTDNPDLFPRQR